MAIRTRELSTEEAYKLMFQDLMLERRTAMPGIITAINLSGSALASVDVQPAIEQLITSDDGLSNTSQPLPIIAGVPVVFPGSTTLGLSITIPLAVGDECLLLVCDRSLDNWQEKGGTQPPIETTTPRAHELTDAVCLPGLFREGTALSDYSSTSLQIRNSDNTVNINLSSDELSLLNGASSIVMSDMLIAITAPTVTINGTLLELNSATTEVSGSFSDSSGVNIEDHVHSDPQGGVTGPPQNP